MKWPHTPPEKEGPLCSICDPETLKKLHISLERTSSSQTEGQSFETELHILNKYATLCIEIASARCWSQCQFTICLPNALSLIHHADIPVRQRGLNLVQNVWKAVLAAERAVQSPDTAADVKSFLTTCLKDMAWHNGQVAREIYQVCAAGGWKAEDEQLRLLALPLFPTR